MRFETPLFALALAVLPALVALYRYGVGRRLAAARAFGADTGALLRRRTLKAACVVAAAGLLAVALMRPQAGETVEDIPRHGRDLIFVVDVSLSMLAEDSRPSRLEAAKAAVRDLVEALGAEGGHRLALVAFAGRASVQVPLTLDYGYLRERLDALAVTSLERPGSLIGDAIRKAASLVKPEAAQFTDLILITDGEDHGGLALEAAEEAGERGIAVHAVGIGDPAQGARIPVPAEGAERAFLRHDGAEVISRLDETLLVQVARLARGAYVGARTGPVALDGLYRGTIAAKAGREIERTSGRAPGELFRWLALAALALLAAEALWPDRPLAQARAAAPLARAGVAAALMLLLAGFARSTDPYDAVARANALYGAGDYAEAADGYRAALEALGASPVARFNLGDALFKLGDYDAAEAAFAGAAVGEDGALAALAYYNLGNLRYAQALDALDDDPGGARRRLEEAMIYYRTGRTLDAANEDMLYNLELAHRLLAMLSVREQSPGDAGAAPRRNGAREPDGEARESGLESGVGGDLGLQSEGRHGQPADPGDMVPQGAPSRDDATQIAPGGGGHYQMSMDEAEQIVDIVRTHSRALEVARRQWQNARMREVDVDRRW